jgi:hypothetical protein
LRANGATPSRNKGAARKVPVMGQSVRLVCSALNRTDCTTSAERGLPYSRENVHTTTSPAQSTRRNLGEKSSPAGDSTPARMPACSGFFSVGPARAVADPGAVSSRKKVARAASAEIAPIIQSVEETRCHDEPAPGGACGPAARRGYSALLGAVGLLVSGCGYFMSSATDGLAQQLTSAILNQDDPKTVQEGAPAYLLLIDGLIEGDPDNVSLLRAGASLYGSYAGVFVEDVPRAQRLTDKARGYAVRALCRSAPAGCGLHERHFEEYAARLHTLTRAEVPSLYAYAAAWAGWIQARPDDWNAVADLPKVKAAMQRVVELEEDHDRGGAHLYLGVLATLLPPALGGKPEQARTHFERALELSRGRHLMARVLYAERYARTVFDRALHDRLLNEVLAAQPREPGLTLMNTLAQQKARKLLASAEKFF